jgi:hypothetical protein
MRTSGFSYDAVKIFCDKNGRMTKVEPQAPKSGATRSTRLSASSLPSFLIQSAMKTRPFLIFSLVSHECLSF